MNKHVMVVEDDRDIREGLYDALTFEGYEVYCSNNGKEALEQLTHLEEEDLPGCIFLDLNMPVMDGKEFLDEIEHQNEKLADIPVCVASANRDLERLPLVHAAAILQKPIDLNQLYSVVHHFCD